MWSLLDAISKGQGLYDNAMRSRILAQEEQDRNAMRQALGLMGEGEQFAGYEDMPAARRPDYLKRAWQISPEAAMKMEERLTAPYALQREIEKQGQIERAKKEADAAVWSGLADKFGLTPAPAAPAGIEADAQGGAEPVPGTSGPAPVNPLAPERSFELGPQGPKISMKSPSGLDQYKVTDERRLAQADFDQKRKEFAYKQGQDEKDLTLRQGDLDVKRTAEQRQGEEFGFTQGKTRQEQIDRITGQIREARAQLSDFAAKRENSLMTPQEFNAASQQVKAEIKNLEQQREALLRGKAAPAEPAPSVLPSSKGKGKATPPTPPTPSSAAPPAPVAPIAPSPQSGLTYKQQTEMAQKNAEQQMTLTRDTIKASQDEADRIAAARPAMMRLMEMVKTKEIGNRLGQLPGGETALRILSKDNDEFQKDRNQLIPMIMKEGQSQMMNTLPELAIHTEMFPSISNHPDVNKKSMVNVANLYEARMDAPQFLSQWAHQHGGSLEGAREEFRQWMMNNPRYEINEQYSRVRVSENKDFLPLDTWMRLRQQYTTKDIMKMRKTGQIVDVGGKIYLKE